MNMMSTRVPVYSLLSEARLDNLHLLISTTRHDLFFESKQIDWPLIQLRDLSDWMSLLSMKFVELVQVVQVCSCFALHAVQFLDPCLETKHLEAIVRV